MFFAVGLFFSIGIVFVPPAAAFGAIAVLRWVRAASPRPRRATVGFVLAVPAMLGTAAFIVLSLVSLA